MGSPVQSFIVVFKEHTPNEVIEKSARECESKGGKITQRYNSALLGFAANLPVDYAESLHVSPHVDYVEPDGEVRTQ